MRELTTLHVDSGRGWRGGQRQVLLLTSGLLELGVRTHLVCPPGSPLCERARSLGVPVSELAMRGPWDVRAMLGLHRLIAAQAPRVVHTHTAHAVSLLTGAQLGGRHHLSVAARRVDFRPSRLGVLRLRRGTDRVIAVSQAIRAVLVASGLPPARVSVVHSGVACEPPQAGLDPEAVRRSLGLTADERLIGSIGELTDHKDHATLIRAAQTICRAHPNVRFVIVGRGELMGQLTRLRDDLGLKERVLLTGFRDDIPSLLASFEIFVMSSKLEGLGTAVLDALMAGLPVIATRAGGLPEMLEDGETGLLVAPADPGALSAGLERLLSGPSLRARLAKAGPDLVRRRFSASHMVEATLAIYRELDQGINDS